MTDKELREAIGEGIVENQVHLFVTRETILQAKREKDCPAVRKLAWAKYVAAVSDMPMPAGIRVRLF